MKLVRALAIVGLVLTSCAPKKATIGKPELLPVFRVAQNNAVVNFILENSTNETLKYAVNDDGNGIVRVDAILTKDGKVISPPTVGETVDALKKKSQVRSLETGEYAIHTINLTEMYGELKAGRYVLTITYRIDQGSVANTDFGLTPVRLESKAHVIIE